MASIFTFIGVSFCSFSWIFLCSHMTSFLLKVKFTKTYHGNMSPRLFSGILIVLSFKVKLSANYQNCQTIRVKDTWMYDFLEDILQRVSKRLCLFEHVFKFDVSVQSIGYAESLSLSKKVSLMFCFFRIFECCPKCRCEQNCTNRSSQGGLRLQLALVRSKVRGWSVITRQDLPKGIFVSLLCGVMRDSSEAYQVNIIPIAFR